MREAVLDLWSTLPFTLMNYQKVTIHVLDLRYDFLIPNENLDDYVKVVVKFMQRDEIEKILER